MDTLVLGLSGEVTKRYNEFDAKIRDKIIEMKKLGDSTAQSYIGNFPEFLLKLMGLYRIGRMSVDESESSFFVMIEEEDFERAVKFLRLVGQSFEEIVSEIRRRSKTKEFKPEDTSRWETLVLEIVRRHGGEIERAVLLRALQKYGVNAQTLNRIVDELVQKNYVQTELRPSSGGRKAIVYKLTN